MGPGIFFAKQFFVARQEIFFPHVPRERTFVARARDNEGPVGFLAVRISFLTVFSAVKNSWTSPVGLVELLTATENREEKYQLLRGLVHIPVGLIKTDGNYPNRQT